MNQVLLVLLLLPFNKWENRNLEMLSKVWQLFCQTLKFKLLPKYHALGLERKHSKFQLHSVLS